MEEIIEKNYQIRQVKQQAVESYLARQSTKKLARLSNLGLPKLAKSQEVIAG